MEPIFAFLKSQASAGVGVLLAYFLFHWVQRGARAEAPRRWAGFVLVAALIGGYLGQYGLPAQPFGGDTLRSHERFFWMLIPWGLATLAPYRHSLLPLAALLPLVLVNSLRGWTWDLDGLTPRLVLPLVAVVLAACGDLIFRRRPGKQSAIQLGLWSACIAGAIGATGAASYATWAGALGLAFGVTTLLAWRQWNAGALDGASLAVLSGAFLLLATRYSDLAPLDAGLLAAALPLSLLAEQFSDSRGTSHALAWIGLFGPIALAGLRIALAGA